MARPPKTDRNLGTVEITEVRNTNDPRSEKQTSRPPPGSELPVAALPSIHPGRPAVPRVTGMHLQGTPRVASMVPPDRELVSSARLHRQIAQLQEQLAEIQRDLSLTNQERAAEAERYDELQVQYITLQRNGAELESRIQLEQESTTNAKQREAELEAEVAMLRESLQQRVRDEMKRLDAEKSTAETSQRALDEQRLAFESKLLDRDLELARLRGEVVVKEELKRTRSRELAAVRATAEAFDAKVREAETVSQGVRNELEQARKEIVRLESDQSSLRDEIARKRAEIEALGAVKATLLALVDGLDRLGGDARALRGEAAAALEAVAEARQSVRPANPGPVPDVPSLAGATLFEDEDEDDAADAEAAEASGDAAPAEEKKPDGEAEAKPDAKVEAKAEAKADDAVKAGVEPKVDTEGDRPTSMGDEPAPKAPGAVDTEWE
jgi:hypothetical protein